MVTLLKPIGCSTCSNLLLELLWAGLIELLLPLGIAPAVEILNHRGIPKAMELGLSTKVGHIGFISTNITQATCVHWRVNIANKVNEELKVYSLLLRSQLATLELSYDIINSGNYITLLVLLHCLVGKALINIGIVPSLGVAILVGIAGIIHPICVVYE